MRRCCQLLRCQKQRRYVSVSQHRWNSSLAGDGCQPALEPKSKAEDSNSRSSSSTLITARLPRSDLTADGFFPEYSQSDQTHGARRRIHDWSESHPDLYDSISDYVKTESAERRACRLLFILLKDYLPPDHARDWAMSTPTWALTLGWHLVQFPFSLKPDHLLFDGTDKRFLPGPARCWPYRLWLGGKLTLNETSVSTNNYWYNMVESVEDVSIKGRRSGTMDSASKAVVRVAKRIGPAGRDDVTDPGVLEFNINNLKEPYQQKSFQPGVGPHLLEEYSLLFSRTRPTFPESGPHRGRKLSASATHTYTLVPTKALLFGWSALTLNAHRIHLDSEFARNEYGARGMMVQGTLMLILCLQYLRGLLVRAGGSRKRQIIRNVEYRNLRPLYVDEPMTMTAWQVSSENRDDTARWRIIICAGEDSSSKFAFDSTVDVDSRY